MSKSTRFGRKEQEAAWKNAEVDALYQLVAADVRVPKPYGYFNDVLIMELVTDAAGQPGAAPGRGGPVARDRARIPRVSDPTDRAHAEHRPHPRRPVGIQRAGRAGRPRHHRSAAGGECGRQQRRVRHARARREQHPVTLGRFAPELLETEFAREMWALFEQGELTSAESSLPVSSVVTPPRLTPPALCERSMTHGRRRSAGSERGTNPEGNPIELWGPKPKP